MSDETNNVVEFPQQPDQTPEPTPGAEPPAAESAAETTTTETASGHDQAFREDLCDVTAPKGMTIEEQIRALEDKIDELDAVRLKSVVEELEFDAAALAIVASDQAEERYKRAWKEGQKLIKQCAWSGMRKVAIESKLPAMTATFVKDLLAHGFKAKAVTINNIDTIEVRW